MVGAFNLPGDRTAQSSDCRVCRAGDESSPQALCGCELQQLEYLAEPVPGTWYPLALFTARGAPRFPIAPRAPPPGAAASRCALSGG
jgi:hypothetical protein